MQHYIESGGDALSVRICPNCRTSYENDVLRCTVDGFRPVSKDDWAQAGNDALLGSTLADRYTLVGKIGAGGMGTVYRAEQAPIGREVALKVLRRDLGYDPETVARFHREGHTLSQLKHPNTVTIFDFGQTDDGLLYLAMELLEGEMLSVRLKREGAMEVEQSVRIAAGVLRSLDEAHTRGIIHRDLKPDNIFLARVHARPEEDELVKVVDFGIAKIKHGDRPLGLDPIATQEGTVFGTPRYMSPEQAQGKALDGRSDLYAVGVLLFHMLTGNPPFTDDDAVIVMAHHIKTVPLLVRTLSPNAHIPASLERLVARALDKDPDARPQTASEFLTLLDATLDEIRTARNAALQPVETTVPPPPPSRPRWGFALSALAALALITGLSVVSPKSSPRNVASRPSPAALAVSPALSPAPPTPAVPEVQVAPPQRPQEPPPAAPPPPPQPTLGAQFAGTLRTAVNAVRPRHSRRHAPPPPTPVSTNVAQPTTPPPTPAQPYPRWHDGEMK